MDKLEQRLNNYSHERQELSENEKLVMKVMNIVSNTLHKDLIPSILNLIREQNYNLCHERIICSAIHYNYGKKIENQPIGIDFGFVITGRRHKDCYDTLKIIASCLNQSRTAEFMSDKMKRESQGFITNRNRYVDRKEGMRIAKAAGQLLRPDLHEGMEDRELTSEDLY